MIGIQLEIEIRLAKFYGRLPFNRAPRIQQTERNAELCREFGCNDRALYGGYCENCARLRCAEVE